MKSFLNLTAILIFNFVSLLHYGTKVVFAYRISHYLDIAMPDKKALTTNSKLSSIVNLNQLNQIFTLH